jgi:hypothetical protein
MRPVHETDHSATPSAKSGAIHPLSIHLHASCLIEEREKCTLWVMWCSGNVFHICWISIALFVAFTKDIASFLGFSYNSSIIDADSQVAP